MIFCLKSAADKRHLVEAHTVTKSSHFSHQSQNRLADLVAEHLDHLHYLNDILCLNITDLNQVLTDHLLHKLLIPLYIYSLAPSRKDSRVTMETVTQNLARVLNRNISVGENSPALETSNGKVSCIVALFLLSQVFLIISHPPLIQTLAWIILKSDREMLQKGVDKLYESYEVQYLKTKDDVQNGAQGLEASSNESNSSKENLLEEQQNITDEEKQRLATAPVDGSSKVERPFLDAIYIALDCVENDYTALFALSLLYAMGNNNGV